MSDHTTITRIQFKLACDFIENHAEVVTGVGYQNCATILSDQLGFEVPDSAVPDMQEATGVRIKLHEEPGNRYKKDRVRPVAIDVLRIMQHIGLSPTPETENIAKGATR